MALRLRWVYQTISTQNSDSRPVGTPYSEPAWLITTGRVSGPCPPDSSPQAPTRRGAHTGASAATRRGDGDSGFDMSAGPTPRPDPHPDEPRAATWPPICMWVARPLHKCVVLDTFMSRLGGSVQSSERCNSISFDPTSCTQSSIRPEGTLQWAESLPHLLLPQMIVFCLGRDSGQFSGSDAGASVLFAE